MSLTFRIYRGTQLLREETLAQPVIKIGKVSSAHLRIDDDSISRMHAIVEVTGGDVSLIDLGSTRGTFVNGQRINKATLAERRRDQVGELRIEVTMSVPGACGDRSQGGDSAAAASAHASCDGTVTAGREDVRGCEVDRGRRDARRLGRRREALHRSEERQGLEQDVGPVRRGRRVRARSAIAFASSVHTAALQQGQRSTTGRTSRKQAGVRSFRAEMLSPATTGSRSAASRSASSR